MASKKVSKPTIAEAFKSAQGSSGSSAIGATGMPGKIGPMSRGKGGGKGGSSAIGATGMPGKVIEIKPVAGKGSSAIGATGMPGKVVPSGKSTSSTKDTDGGSSSKAKIAAAPGARPGAKAAGIGAPSVTKGKKYPPGQTPSKSTTTTTTTSTTPKAKPYEKLKQPAREAARRKFVNNQLKRLGITPAGPGKPRSAKEKAARAKARATWDKKNPFVPKSKAEGNMSPSDAARERRPEA